VLVVDFDVDGEDGIGDDDDDATGVCAFDAKEGIIWAVVVVRRLVISVVPVVFGFVVFLADVVVVRTTPPLFTFVDEGVAEVIIGVGALDTIGVAGVVVAAFVVHVVIAEEVTMPLLLYVVKMVTVVKIVLVRVVVDLSDDEIYPLDMGPFDEDDPVS